MFWLMVIWSVVIVVLVLLYRRPGFRKSSEILKDYGGPKVRIGLPSALEKAKPAQPPKTD